MYYTLNVFTWTHVSSSLVQAPDIGVRGAGLEVQVAMLALADVTDVTYMRTAEMAQQANCLYCKHEDLCLGPQHPCKGVGMTYTCGSSARETGGQMNLCCFLVTQTIELVSSCLKKWLSR